MKAEKFSDALTNIDEKYIDEAIHYRGIKKRFVWQKWAAIAACFCIIVGLAVAFTSTEDPPIPTENVYPGTETYPIFLESVRDSDSPFSSDVSLIPTEPMTQKPEESKEFIFDGKTYNLQYEESRDGYHRYSSEDTKVECDYYDHSGLIRSINLVRYYEKGQPNYANEQQYIEAVKKMVSAYYDENWDEYKYHCETRILKDGGQDSYLEYVDPKDDTEKVSMRIFRFVKYVDDFPTTDSIYATFAPMIGTVGVVFSAHEFDEISTQTLDTEKLSNSIDAFFKNSINADKSRYNGYKINQTSTGELGRFTIVNGELYFVCSVSVQTTSKSSGLSGTEQSTLCSLYIKLPTE